MGSGGWQDESLFVQVVQDWNEGGKSGAKDRCRSVLGWQMGGGGQYIEVEGGGSSKQ